MTVESEVANLTTAVDNLTSSVNVKKATLDASVADSESARDQSQAARDTANLHKLAAEAAATSATSTAAALTGFDLEAIAASKAVTAVDVFVYDTSKDSDGGAWRHRCQDKSWYNEPLNTVTRGARREFPAVAVIVATAGDLIIYDGDDPSLPMWMVFKQNTFEVMLSNPRQSVFALNGVLAGGADPYDLTYVNFIQDAEFRHTSTGFQKFNGVISNRNEGLSRTALSSAGIASRTVNDVAMTVLPDAPIDPATGLPVPTIAVATEGGVSVIKDDGTVQNISTEAHFGVAFSPDGTLLVQDSVFNKLYTFLAPTDSDFVSVGSIGNTITPNQSRANSGRGVFIDNTTVAFGGGSTVGTNSLRCLQTYKLDFIGGRPAHMNALTTSTYNTGWMNGDIKGAFLADTDDTDLVGSGELVTNGTFDTDTSGWTLSTAGASQSVVSGKLRITIGGGEANARTYQAITTVVGKVYAYAVDAFQETSTVNPQFKIGTVAGGSNIIVIACGPDDGTFTGTFVATTTTTYVTVQNNGGGDGAYADFDNISVKLADADRSVNNNGLIVNGTVTRSPVATGAELVAYSGFSATNYLEQPYNADLDFGTGDFCVMGWVKTESTQTDYIFDLNDASDVGPKVRVITSGGDFSSRIGTSSVTHSAVPSGWSHFVLLRQGGVASFYTNGSFVDSRTATDDLSNASAVLKVGVKYDNTSPWGGSLALLRISATAPTADQILKIYNDEKVLFQENAAATLYGTSDAVTALAHDDATNLLHVGTSAGRSVFQGLRRVSNTTTAVGTAISASNGLVVEE